MKTGRLYVNGRYGREFYPVKIVCKFFAFYRIEALGITRLSADNHYLLAGQRAWVPYHAVQISNAVGIPKSTNS